ncbi:glycoside hydrolase family 32 protein [Peribacillus sp. SCS-155]|uniref:glycoside hydrolase family 32 protein n=1 Tax=Peribacillus sedimenti TaxID=3115297 RepID=UPI00390655C8
MVKHNNVIEEAMKSLAATKEKVSTDPCRLKFHVTAPAFWINDPNGFSFFKGEYHLFYQHHPYSPEWGPMYWGHVKSKDLVHWEQLPIALAPDQEYDKDGCFSGSAIEKDGELYLMYTGNVWTGPDHDTDLKQVQCLAFSEDGVHFKKLLENPVIKEAPDGDVHPFHFRDPKVWKQGEFYYCILGSRTKSHIGQVLLYRSHDLIVWEFVNIAAKAEGNLGYMWECPDLFHLGGYDVLMMSPQGMEPEGNLYHNLHQAGYVLGSMDYDKGILSHGEFHLLDYGFDFYAPQTLTDDQGRRIMIAWMAMWESEMPEQSNSWAGAMTIPRELKMKKGKIFSTPVAELQQLRTDQVTYENIKISGEQSLDGISGEVFELEVAIDPKSAIQFGLKLRVGNQEETELLYDKDSGTLSLDRSVSGSGPTGVRSADIDLIDSMLKLHIFIDSSSVEVFVNGGEKVMTARIYPDKQSTGVTFFSDEQIEIIKVNKWGLSR